MPVTLPSPDPAAKALSDQLNAQIIAEINQTGKIFLSHTKLNGRFVIRIVISGLRVEERHVLLAWEIINQKYEKLNNKRV